MDKAHCVKGYWEKSRVWNHALESLGKTKRNKWKWGKKKKVRDKPGDSSVLEAKGRLYSNKDVVYPTEYCWEAEELRKEKKTS